MGTVRFLFKIVYAAFFIILSSSANAKEEDHPVYTRYATEITKTFVRQVKKEFGLDCEGSGGGMPYDVEKISVSFGADRSATLEQARELEVILTEKFVKLINAHEKIRPFLREYPFPASRAVVSLSFYPPSKKKQNQHAVDYLFQANGKIYYKQNDPNTPYAFITLLVEPYEEALKIVQGNANQPPIP